MRRRHQGQQVEQFRRRIHLAEGERIRSMIKSWALLAEFEIVAPENLPANIQDRDADVWESLITVADAVGGEWPARTRAAAVALVSESKEREPSLGVRLLADLKEIFGHAQEITTEAILRALHALNESPWNDLKGKPLNDRGLAQRLRQYEIKPRVLGGGSHRGYRREDLHDAWDRYLAPPPISDGSVTSVTGQPFHQPSPIADVTDVTLVAANGANPILMAGASTLSHRMTCRSLNACVHEQGRCKIKGPRCCCLTELGPR
jgi:hypothetical protein